MTKVCFLFFFLCTHNYFIIKVHVECGPWSLNCVIALIDPYIAYQLSGDSEVVYI